MSEKNLKARIVHKHDTEANWLKATNFIPKQGEIIIYDIDDNYNYERVKVGDGKTVVSALPFIESSKAEIADRATEADHATSADTATNANHAVSADTATNADTVGGKSASDFALAADLDTLETLVGDTSVSSQISAAVSPINTIIYQDSDDHINIDRVSEDYMNSNVKITGRDIIFTDYAMDEYPIIDTLNNKVDKGHKHAATDITSGTLDTSRLPVVPIKKGGTGVTTLDELKANLGVADSEWTQIYDSGAITTEVNAFANINITGYKKLMVAVKCVNDGTERSSKQGSITFISSTGTQYQFPVWTAMFTNTEETTGNMGWFEIMDGWIICSNASRNLETNNFLSSTEGGTADNLAGIGGCMMKCTKTLSSIMISALDQDEDRYFNAGSRVIVWGCK